MTTQVPTEKLQQLKRGDHIVIAYRNDETDLREVRVRRSIRARSLIIWDDPGITTTWGDIPYDKVREILGNRPGALAKITPGETL